MAKEPKPFTDRQVRISRPALRVMGKLNTHVYRLTKGKVGGKFPGGAPVLLLHTVGRRSGKERVSPLLYLDDGNRYIVVASQGGMPTNPAWFHNLSASPKVTAEVGAERHDLRARVVSDDERAELWPRLVAMYKNYDDYQARTDRKIPVVALEPRA